MYELDLEQADKPEVKLPTYVRTSKKQESSRKTSTSALLTKPKPLSQNYVAHNKLWKILKEMEYQTTWPAFWQICMQVRKQQLELDVENCRVQN